ncbi:MAG: transposase, partial [Hafnia sp.]
DVIALGKDTRVIMEATGRYHEPVAAALHEYGIYVPVLNPLFIKQSGGGSIRKVKTDKADALKIAKYGLDNWADLREYTLMEAVRQQLKLYNRQYNLYMKTIVALTNNLISLSDKTFPGVNELFSSPERADGSSKWVDLFTTFWHCECICNARRRLPSATVSDVNVKAIILARIRPPTCIRIAAATSLRCPRMTILSCSLPPPLSNSPPQSPPLLSCETRCFALPNSSLNTKPCAPCTALAKSPLHN